MNNPKVTHLPTPQHSQMKMGVVTGIENSVIMLDSYLPAKQAVSCLVKPVVGDQVMYWSNGNEHWVLAILTRTDEQQTEACREIALPQNQGMRINTDQLIVNASQKINLNTLGDININASLGQLNLSAKACYQTVKQSLVQISSHFFNKAEFMDTQAKKLLKTHATQHMMTAEKDIKIDADRINMG